MKLLFFAFAAILAGLGPGAQAQSTEAARYVNPQGIEVIQARRPPAVEEAKVPTEKNGSVIKAMTGTNPAPVQASAALDSRLLVSNKEQRDRDQDRLAILTQELATENAGLQTKIRVLQDPALKAGLSASDLKRLGETAMDHEKNIRALNAEIGRVRLRR
jgi:hypothetical protein